MIIGLGSCEANHAGRALLDIAVVGRAAVVREPQWALDSLKLASKLPKRRARPHWFAVPVRPPPIFQRLAVLACALWLLLAATAQAWDAERLLAVAATRSERAAIAARSLHLAMAGWRSRSEAQQIQAVNDYLNQQIVYREDIDLWGVADYWASPLETLEKGAGDCEDYAIAKYFVLVALGVPQRKLRMVYVRASWNGMSVPHMVLAYYPTADADPWVMDSLVRDLRPASSRSDLSPVFSFNAEGLWEGTGRVGVAGRPAERLSNWGEVLRKARQEGFL
jgi:predicted transglutaminase-like cysteine proteinase